MFDNSFSSLLYQYSANPIITENLLSMPGIIYTSLSSATNNTILIYKSLRRFENISLSTQNNIKLSIKIFQIQMNFQHIYVIITKTFLEVLLLIYYTGDIHGETRFIKHFILLNYLYKQIIFSCKISPILRFWYFFNGVAKISSKYLAPTDSS